MWLPQPLGNRTGSCWQSFRVECLNVTLWYSGNSISWAQLQGIIAKSLVAMQGHATYSIQLGSGVSIYTLNLFVYVGDFTRISPRLDFFPSHINSQWIIKVFCFFLAIPRNKHISLNIQRPFDVIGSTQVHRLYMWGWFALSATLKMMVPSSESIPFQRLIFRIQPRGYRYRCIGYVANCKFGLLNEACHSCACPRYLFTLTYYISNC